MRILFVAMANSVHTARWIAQLSGQGWDVHLVPVDDSSPHVQLREVTFHQFLQPKTEGLDASVEALGVWRLPRGSYTASRIVGRLAPATWNDRAWRLARTIKKLKPDLVHSLEIQRAGYLTLAARGHFDGAFPPWAISNWGSDICVFGRLREHVEKIKAVLAACDYYGCECQRDVALGREYGFRGEFLPVLPNAGGFDLQSMRTLRQPGLTSDRRYVVLKGYQNWAGRALAGLRALELCADALKGYRIAVYLAEPDTALAAELFSQRTGLPVEILPPGQPHEKVLRLHGQARISLGLSIGDAISTSALEAMIMGAFPIQSNTSCFDEWAKDGVGAILVHPEDPEQIATAVRVALSNNELVDRAAENNARTAAERLDKNLVQQKVVAMYEKISAQERRRTTDDG